MTRKRAFDFSLDRAIDDPGFTPRSSDAAGLVAILGTDADDARALRAAALLLRIDGASPALLHEAARHPSPEARRRALRALGRFDAPAHGAGVSAIALPLLADDDPGVRRAAARLAGKLALPGADDALRDAATRETDERVAGEIRLALARRGGHVDATADGVHDAASASTFLIAARERARGETTTLHPEREVDVPFRLVVRVRRGLEGIARAELAAMGIASTSERPGELEADARSFAAARSSRVALDHGFVRALAAGATLEEATTATLVEAGAIMRCFTDGPIRYRLRFEGRGKARGAVRAVAVAAAAADPGLVNETSAPDWEVVVDADAPRALFVLRAPDARFSYRAAEVPAASHPTVAAALARAARVGDADVVWDPFVGSGLELCERHLLGGVSRLVGTDVDAAAVAAARTNLEAAGAAHAELHHVDARRFEPPSIDAMVTNAPLGRRVVRDGTLADVLVGVLERAVAALRPGGKIVLTSPHPRTTHGFLRDAGLDLRASTLLDMGGFSVDLAVFEKPRPPGKRRIIR